MSDEAGLSSLVRYIITGLVQDEAAVKVETVKRPDGEISYQIQVAPEDYGRIIGRGGIVANSVRAVVKAAAAKSGQKVYVDILK
jgi:hypothetical protein